MTLQAQLREATENVENLRADSRIPAVIYGGAREGAQSLSIDRSAYLKLYRQITSSTLIDLSIDGTVVQALVGEMQLHVLNEDFLHVDFRQVDLAVPVKVSVDLIFVGEAPAVKMLGGSLVINREKITVKALPEQLMPSIEINLGDIDSFAKSIHVRDITLPEGVVLMDDANASVVIVTAPKTKAQLDAEDAADAAAATTAAPVAEVAAEPAAPEKKATK